MAEDFPLSAFRVTAFADILGWGPLTAGIDQLIVRKLSQNELLSAAERASADDFQRRMTTAATIDGQVRQVLHELREFATPIDDISADRGPKHFWLNRHITFTRFSDNVFMHSTSFQWVAQFLSELLKRGLERGVLFRAGLSAGCVFHTDPPLTALDTRSRDVSLYGDAITMAVEAERAGKGRGARVLVHPRLVPLLNDGLELALQPIDGCLHGVGQELRWWMDFPSVFPATSVCDSIPSRENWPQMACDLLRSAPVFDWNRASDNGRAVLDDTIRALSTDPAMGA